MSDFKISKEKENEIMAYFGEISDLSCGNDPCCACEYCTKAVVNGVTTQVI